MESKVSKARNENNVPTTRRASEGTKTFVRQICDDMVDTASKLNICSAPPARKSRFAEENLNDESHFKKCRSPTRRKSASPSPRPRFVSRVEAFVERELRKTTRRSSGQVRGRRLENRQFDCDARLQVFREALAAVIYGFTTLQPILTQIRDAYEAAIKVRDDRIQDANAVKSTLMGLETQCEDRLSEIRLRNHQEMENLKKERLELLLTVKNLQEELKTSKSINEKLKNGMTEEHKKFMDAVDSRRLVLMELADVRHQMESIMHQKDQSGSVKLNMPKEDPVILKIALEKCREDLSNATKKLNEMEASYTEVVPRRELEYLEATHHSFLKKHRQLQNQSTAMQKDYDTLLEKVRLLEKENSELLTNAENMRGVATPRPEWSKCSAFIRGGPERWLETVSGKSSKDILDILLFEICGRPTGEAVELFQGRGTGPEVPPFLRYEGFIRNRKLEMNDILILINDIWKEKDKIPMPTSLKEFVGTYFIQRYHLPILRYEWIYALMDGCSRLKNANFQIGLFYGILMEDYDEKIYYSYQRDIKLLHKCLRDRMEALELEGSTAEAGTVAPQTFRMVASVLFPLRSQDFLDRLLKAATEQLNLQNGDFLPLEQLFKESDAGFRGPLFVELAEQMVQEKEEYANEILCELDVDEHMEETRTMRELKTAFQFVDPHLQESTELKNYLSWVLKTPVADIEDAPVVAGHQIYERIMKGDIKRFGPKVTA